MQNNEKNILLEKDLHYKLLNLKQQDYLKSQQKLTFQQKRELMIMLIDLESWQRNDDINLTKNINFAQFRQFYEACRHEELKPHKVSKQPETSIKIEHKSFPTTVLGLCPVNSQKTRCCQLKTLDTVQGCGFGCAYCAIPTFYNGPGQVAIANNLATILDNIVLDAQKYYHIGTGQASDSLLYTTVSDATLLCNFARQHQANVILELKSKSHNIEPFLAQAQLPANMLFTWSLNPQLAIDAWEHKTSSLEERLNAAEKLIAKGAKVGFHLHPIIPFENYEETYRALVDQIIERFNSDDVVTISFGTLTFSKVVLKHLRLNNPLKINILQLPLEQAAGKYSLPHALKLKMFQATYQKFQQAGWQRNVFFYLCMEDEALWQPVFGYQYATNEAFEEAMLTAYFKKMLHHQLQF